MGERTRSMIGTMDGMATVHVYSANPKTADGYNTFIFRRDIEKSLRKLMWSPILELRDDSLPTEVLRSEDELVYVGREKEAVRAFVVSMANAQKGPLVNDDFGRISIARDFVKEVQLHAIRSRIEIAAVSSAREIASTMVHVCGSPNEEMRRKNGVLFFEYGLQRVRLHGAVYLVLGEIGIKANSRPYYDQRIAAKFKADSEAPSLHGHLHIGESAFERIYDNRFRLILQGVEQYYRKMVKYST